MVVKQTVNNNNSIGVIGLLWVAFIIMKLMVIIDWSWFVVICWPIGLWFAILFFALCLAGLGYAMVSCTS